jgi:hypothetical protein
MTSVHIVAKKRKTDRHRHGRAHKCFLLTLEREEHLTIIVCHEKLHRASDLRQGAA